MKTYKSKGHIVEMYESISELPITRYHVYNKMLLLDSGIGSDIADFDGHLERVCAFIAQKDNDSAIKELQNMRQNIYFIHSALSTTNFALAALIKSIDGKERNDISDEGLAETIALINDMTIGEVNKLLSDLKKKVESELSLYFPDLYADGVNKEYYNIITERTKLVLDSVINDTDNEAAIKDITNKVLTYMKPHTFEGEKNLELASEKQFENMCMMITDHMHVNPKNYTVVEFYTAFQYIRDKSKAQRKRNGKSVKV